MDKFQADASTTHRLHNGAVDRGGHEQKDVSYSIWIKKCLRWIEAMSRCLCSSTVGKRKSKHLYIYIYIYIYVYSIVVYIYIILVYVYILY